MMHLTLKRLEAPGSLEVRWGGGWGHPCGDGAGEDADEILQTDRAGPDSVRCALRMPGTAGGGGEIPPGHAGGGFCEGAPGTELVPYVVSLPDTVPVCHYTVPEMGARGHSTVGGVPSPPGAVPGMLRAALCQCVVRMGRGLCAAG